MPFPDSFTTERLRAERLTPDHLAEVQRMHRDPAVMAHLGGVRDEERTAAYLARNLQHWADYGFGLWILREVSGGDPVGRAVLRHLSVEGVDEVEVGYGFYQPDARPPVPGSGIDRRGDQPGQPRVAAGAAKGRTRLRA